MIPVAQTKKELAHSRDLTDIIDALKMIASAQFRISSSQMQKEDLLRDKIIGCLNLLTPSICVRNPFFVQRQGIPKAFLLVCSDEGFLGELNSIIVDAALRRGLEERAKFIVLGERGARILKDSEVEFISFAGVGDNLSLEQIRDLTNYIMDLYKQGQICALSVVYMRFESFTRRHLDVVKLLPCEQVSAYIKEKGPELETLIEPEAHLVIEYLVKAWLKNSLYNIFCSSKLSEWSVRVMHLEQSSDELKQMNQDLKFKYFKSLHALNDKNIREIFAARTLL